MITATVLTKNSHRTLAKTLDSLTRFDEVILLDSGSTDDTLKIAEKYPNVTIHTTPFLGFGPMHNYATKLATHDWILSVDSDEVLSEALIDEIFKLELDPEAVYRIKRENYFNQKRIKGCSGWYPDPVIRLYNRTSTKFSDDAVHEKVESSEMRLHPLSNPLIHTPYLEISDFLDKMQVYSTLYADQRKGEPSSLLEALFKGWFTFIKSYF
ncbi:MAG: hypothetical protein KR126chlam1_01380, partial [Chlamydiae bacterium]|nr:hypothetical protein [Chlamydiota bacterium]